MFIRFPPSSRSKGAARAGSVRHPRHRHPDHLVVRELFRRCVEDHESIGGLTRYLGELDIMF